MNSGCLTGMDYRLCDWQINCSTFGAISNCSDSNCVTGCFCSNGTVLDNSVCIYPDTCPSKHLYVTTYAVNNQTFTSAYKCNKFNACIWFVTYIYINYV